MTTLAAPQSLVAQGESATLELKRSTAELKRAGETLCAFLNGEGGKVLIGVAPDGKLVGQDVADITLRDLAAMLGRFEPPARIEMSRVDVGHGRQVIVLEALPARQFAPFVFESKPYKRVGSTTTVRSQEEYARLLPDPNHSRRRWENQPAVGVRLEDLDREEILRTRATAIEQRRLSAGTSMDFGDILDRLGLRIDGQVTQAAQMLYGTKFLPNYPQALLKLGRFRGTKITGGIAEPTFTEGSGAVTVTFKAEIVAGAGDLVPGGHQVGTKLALSPYQVQMLELADVPRALAELMVLSGRTDRTKFRDQIVAPALEAGLLEMTIPDKPRSSKQQYRITKVGRAVLATARKA